MPSTRKKRSLARSVTLFGSAERRRLFMKARSVFKHPSLEIRSAPSQLDYGRVLIVVPRKVGSAPERNQIKRRVRSLFYEMELYTYRKDLIIFALPGAADLSFDFLATEIKKAVSQ